MVIFHTYNFCHRFGGGNRALRPQTTVIRPHVTETGVGGTWVTVAPAAPVTLSNTIGYKPTGNMSANRTVKSTTNLILMNTGPKNVPVVTVASNTAAINIGGETRSSQPSLSASSTTVSFRSGLSTVTSTRGLATTTSSASLQRTELNKNSVQPLPRTQTMTVTSTSSALVIL